MSSERVTHFYGCQLTTTNSVKQHKLRKLIAWLSDKEGKGKEFVSLYIPPSTSIEAVAASLKKESEQINVDSHDIVERLQDAVKNAIHHVKQYKEIPENGLALFAGAFKPENQESAVSHVEEIIPPEPVEDYLFAVDDHFALQPLRQMLRDERIVGFLVMDSKDACFGIFEGGHLETVEKLTSGVPGKTVKGGQSQRRYERERDMELTFFYHRIAEAASKAFLENRRVTALFVGGPGQTKNDFLKGDYLNYELRNALLDVFDTQSANAEALREMLDKSSDALMHMCGPEEKKNTERLLTELNKQTGLAVYGLDPVLNMLKAGAVDVALVTDNTNLVELSAQCKKCGRRKTEILNKKDKQAIQAILSSPCEQCGAVEYEAVEKDMVDVLEDAASQTNARVEVIFTDSEEKAKLTGLGGFAALLRYKQ